MANTDQQSINMNLNDCPTIQSSLDGRISTVISIHTNGIQRSYIPFVRKISIQAMVRYCKNWVKHPMNIALLIWLFFVAVCLVVLFLFMTGLLNEAIPKSSVRKKWIEIFNQIINALFTIMCLYQHPRISHHLFLLCRWRLTDEVELRNIYSSNGMRKPHERAHMMFVIFLLHMTCFFQYGLCTLFWAYESSTRPELPQYLLIAFGTVAPIIAALYTFLGPLGGEKGVEKDEETETLPELMQCDKKMGESSPEWVGGLFDCWDDQSTFYLSFFCTFCMFGWNMERLGLGNIYAHIATFILLCCAPVVVFCVTAHNIDHSVIRYIVGSTGVVLCLLGLLYGGFWRAKMRKKFKLPENHFCCGNPDFTDYMQWLFCWSCSLAQEVRTANFYDVGEDGRFYRREMEEGIQREMVHCSRETGAGPMALPTLGSPRIHSVVSVNEDMEISGHFNGRE